MNRKIAQQLRRSKEKINNRLEKAAKSAGSSNPVMSSEKITYEIGAKGGGVSMGGMGAVHSFAKKIGLDKVIDEKLHVLKFHKPYHESDHVLSIAYNAMCGGKAIQDIELMRQDENFLNILGAASIPDPTTAGDFCRRFSADQIHILMDAFNEKRQEIWAKQPADFFEVARVDADGTLVKTFGETKGGMDISYNGIWGYHPLLVSLANTGEPLYIANRSGNVASHEGAAGYFDKAISLLKDAGFRKILLRGDTDFALTANFDRWTNDGVKFVFGYDARKNLIENSELFSPEDWERMERRASEEFDETNRKKPENVKEGVIIRRGFENIRLNSEDVLEFLYRPIKCEQDYRIIALRKNLDVSKYGKPLFHDVRYFFYITNDDSLGMFDAVKEAGSRCNQENLIEQHKNGVNAFRAPLDTLEANWAWMVLHLLPGL